MTAGPPRKILFIGLNYAPEPIGIGPFSAGLAESLVARGHRVHAVVGQPYYPDWKLHPRFKGRWQASEENGVTVMRCPHYIPANPTGKKRLAHHMSFASSAYPAARAARRALEPDLVFTVAPSLVAAPVAARMARREGVPLWLHVQDFEVGAAFATGLLDREGGIADAATRFEDRMLRAADMISTISEPMCTLLTHKGIPPSRVLELRNWANHAQQIAAADGGGLRKEWGLEGKFVALYSGNIANKQGLEVVIEAARRLAHRSDIAFVVSGEGPNRVRLEQQAQGLPNMQFRDLQPPENFGALLTLADVHLLPQLPGAADLVLPSKLGNMFASARPVIATAAPGTGIAREVEGCGIVIPPLDDAAMAQAIEALAADPARRAEMGANGQRRAEALWSRTAIVDKFETAMQALLG
ncbi:WcaI family glycosyltransferase [Qipengyuania marisflavi]|uniref:Colanic acid biosynthesis glycosyltransferase WcaI n=1 Tax=Qipengyuania marisflavi TaxID=2486356 RepID=A0A5S3PXT2_9SPHN|nr:WcaI family glycosyltransferase [Qipengyuania marisflavi]TMM48405.1 colanic acid biosynthesis glycosyltransferase WcaI [Qipengyuania marisflavi]